MVRTLASNQRLLQPHRVQNTGMSPKEMYLGYPEPVEAPVVSEEATIYRPVPTNNPTLSGLPLTILSKVVANVGPVADLLWINSGFRVLRRLHAADTYQTRFEPLVIPHFPEPTSGDASLFTEGRDTTFYSSADYVAAYTAGRTTPFDVAQYLLKLIQDPPHKLAFVETREDLTLEAAKASTTRYAHGMPKGPLDGVPFFVKDEADIHGYKTTYGSAKIHNNGDGETTWAVKRLEQAGAILIGKANMHELGTDTTNNNPIKGTPRNPYNKGYYTGGSSGGSAYAVGSGLVPFAVGADGGGSIRVPSSYCGVYGIKPSHGRISARPSVSVTPGNGVFGPIASSLEDLALVYRVMSEPDPQDPSSSGFPLPRAPLTSLSPPSIKRIGIYRPWFDDAPPDITSLCNSAVERLVATEGYELIELPTIPYLNEARVAHALSIITEITTFVNGDFSSYNAANQILLSVASRTSALDFNYANKVRNMFMSHFASLWEKYPGMILVTPTSPMPGVKIEESHLRVGVSDTNSSLQCMRYVFLANFIGTPSLTAPVGYLENNIPVGLMGLAEWGKEEDLFGWGNEVAEGLAKGSGRKKSEIWVDVLDGVGTAGTK